MTKVVYFIRNTVSGTIKIGWSGHAVTRIPALQIGSADKLEFIGATPGGEELERSIHAELVEYRVRGEWFLPSPEVLARIDALVTIRKLSRVVHRQRYKENKHLETARRWLVALLREAELKPHEVCALTGITPGVLETIKRRRVKSLSIDDFEKIRIGYMRNTSERIAALEAELAEHRRSNTLPSCEALLEADAHLAKASALLNRTAQ